MTGRSFFSFAAALSALLIILIGCSSSGQNQNTSPPVTGAAPTATGPPASPPPLSGRTGTLALDFSSVTVRDASSLDNAITVFRVQGYHRGGALIFGPVDLPRASTQVVRNVPVEVTRVVVQYLRNGAVRRYSSVIPVDLSSGSYLAKNFTATSDPTTVTWATTKNAQGYWTLTQTVDQNAPTTFRIKGVCYSPVRAGDTGSNLPFLGDRFFDTVTPTDTNSPIQQSFYSVWGSGTLQGTNVAPPNGCGTAPCQARNDLQTLKDMGVNCIRVYAMMPRWAVCSYDESTAQCNWTYPSQNPDDYQGVTHTQFLDACYQMGIFVLVDVPMPNYFFQLGNQAPNTSANEAWFWEDVLSELTTASTVNPLGIGDHPAVLGFNIMNEQDAEPWYDGNYNGTGFHSDACTDYFWGQAKKYATTIKANAPGKLVGWAVHDSPNLVAFGSTFLPFSSTPPPTTVACSPGPSPSVSPTGYCGYCPTATNLPAMVTAASLDTSQTYMAQIPFDYWGVNSYQDVYWTPTIGTLGPVPTPTPATYGLAYGDLYPSNPAYKPVIFTETGWPATTHDAGGNIEYTTTSGTNTANTITCQLTSAYSSSYSHLFLGAFYFEFCDEWWKQGNSITVWSAGPADSGRPNCYDDEEGFGIFGITPGAGQAYVGEPYVTYYDQNGRQNIAPALPNDVLGQGGYPSPSPSPRTAVLNAITDFYSNLPAAVPSPQPSVQPSLCATPVCP